MTPTSGSCILLDLSNLSEARPRSFGAHGRRASALGAADRSLSTLTGTPVSAGLGWRISSSLATLLQISTLSTTRGSDIGSAYPKEFNGLTRALTSMVRRLRMPVSCILNGLETARDT